MTGRPVKIQRIYSDSILSQYVMTSHIIIYTKIRLSFTVNHLLFVTTPSSLRMFVWLNCAILQASLRKLDWSFTEAPCFSCFTATRRFAPSTFSLPCRTSANSPVTKMVKYLKNRISFIPLVKVSFCRLCHTFTNFLFQNRQLRKIQFFVHVINSLAGIRVLNVRSVACRRK